MRKQGQQNLLLLTMSYLIFFLAKDITKTHIWCRTDTVEYFFHLRVVR